MRSTFFLPFLLVFCSQIRIQLWCGRSVNVQLALKDLQVTSVENKSRFSAYKVQSPTLPKSSGEIYYRNRGLEHDFKSFGCAQKYNIELLFC